MNYINAFVSPAFNFSDDLEPAPPGTICPVCGSEDIEDSGESLCRCHPCGAIWRARNERFVLSEDDFQVRAIGEMASRPRHMRKSEVRFLYCPLILVQGDDPDKTGYQNLRLANWSVSSAG